MRKTWWFVFFVSVIVIDGLSYWMKTQAQPISIFDVYHEYSVNHQALTPLLIGPLFTVMGSYFIANLLGK